MEDIHQALKLHLMTLNSLSVSSVQTIRASANISLSLDNDQTVKAGHKGWLYLITLVYFS